jgi:hypothetical protein
MIDKTKRTLRRLTQCVKDNPDLLQSFVTLAVEYEKLGLIKLDSVGMNRKSLTEHFERSVLHEQV